MLHSDLKAKDVSMIWARGGWMWSEIEIVCIQLRNNSITYAYQSKSIFL